MKISIIPAIIVPILCSLTASHAGRLDEVRSAVRGDQGSSSSSGSNSSSHRDDDEDDDDDRHRSSNRGNHSLFGNHFYEASLCPITPWFTGSSVNHSPSSDALSPIPENAFEIRTEWGHVDSQTDRIGLRASALIQNIVIRGGFHAFSEDTPSGTDRLDLFDAQIGLLFFSDPSSYIYGAIGLLGIHDDIGTDSGIFLEVGGAALITSQISANASIGAGSIEQANTFRARADIGLHLGNTRTFIGYEHMEFDTIDLGGLYFGFSLGF